MTLEIVVKENVNYNEVSSKILETMGQIPVNVVHRKDDGKTFVLVDVSEIDDDFKNVINDLTNNNLINHFVKIIKFD